MSEPLCFGTGDPTKSNSVVTFVEVTPIVGVLDTSLLLAVGACTVSQRFDFPGRTAEVPTNLVTCVQNLLFYEKIEHLGHHMSRCTTTPCVRDGSNAAESFSAAYFLLCRL